MSGNDKLHIIVAETSPIIGNGILHCLSIIPDMQIKVFEVNTYADLVDCIKSTNPEIVIVNPTFGGSFDPQQLKADANREYKLMAIEVGVMDKHARSLYDATLSIVDDLKTMTKKVKELIKSDDEPTDDKETLSQREKEIIRLVVKGLTNKEIADELYLSVYTVNTHRRNISRKLEIHSATGLTIYAIVNQLVDLSEIKM